MSNPASKAFSKLIRNLKVALGRAERAKKTVEKAKIPTLAARRRKSEAAKNANKAKLAAYEGAVDKLDQHARQAEELADRILKTGKDVKNRLAKEAKKKAEEINESAESIRRAELPEREANRKGVRIGIKGTDVDEGGLHHTLLILNTRKRLATCYIVLGQA